VATRPARPCFVSRPGTTSSARKPIPLSRGHNRKALHLPTRPCALKWRASAVDHPAMPTHRTDLRRLRTLAAPIVVSVLAVGAYLIPPNPPGQAPVTAHLGFEATVPAAAARELPAVADVDPDVAAEPQAGPEAPTPEAAPELEPEAPTPEAAPTPAPAPEPEPCAAALDWVAGAGLPLPPGVGVHCPSTQFAHQGAACWDAWPCPGTGFIAINLALGAGATPEYLRHVVAHEICHIYDFQGRGWSTEAGADACAAAHGAPA
jgi:hypothetical protein